MAEAGQSQTESQARSGALKIFFGYAAGVGKTFAMLSAAQSAQKAGVDVVAGYVEPHTRPETVALMEGLERLPTLPLEYHGATLQEFDLDAALRRKPRLILVDEMAHTNAKGCRHLKRYQDIQELLRHGIDVYTTVNVQHVESLNDVVEAITGIAVRERVPDKVFDSAAQVELVDIEPDELLARLKEGKVYAPAQAQRAMGNFFTRENLAALREIALRRTADIVNRAVERNKILQRRSDYFTTEHVLVCLSSSPSNPRVIRTGARMAEAFHGKLTALYVETTASARMSEENRTRLEAHTRLAEELGAHLATVPGDDVAWQVAEYAKAGGVSKIVMGRPGMGGFWKSNFIDQLIPLAPHLDIYVIPNQLRQPGRASSVAYSSGGWSSKLHISRGQGLLCAALITAGTLVGMGFRAMGFSEASIILAYIPGALLAALSAKGFMGSMLYSLGSVLAFNFFFTEPRFSFHAYDPAHWVTFGIMVVVGTAIGSLTRSLQEQKTLAAHKAYRTSLLLETSQTLQRARDSREIMAETARQLMRLLERDVMFYPVRNKHLGHPLEASLPQEDGTLAKSQSGGARAVAEWCLQNRKQAGAGTGTLPGASCLCLCVRGKEEALGVVSVAVGERPLDTFERELLASVLGECALALEMEQSRESKAQAFQQARQESLRANLLRAISHDLRTPLTGISGNAHLLRTQGDQLSEETRKRLYTDMYDDATWLTGLVENILSVTRLEDASVELKLEPELIADCLAEAMRHVNRKSEEHHLETRLEDDLLMARMDTRLIMQVIVNLVDNAIKYTPAGSTIVIGAKRLLPQHGGGVEISVSDNGEGIPEEARARIFDMFYTVNSAGADSRRGLGLGLFLCRAIVAAHGGSLNVSDNSPVGSVFSFVLEEAVMEGPHA